MDVLQHSTHLILPDQRVAVSGDWHGNVTWVRMLARALTVLAPEVKTILQLGDWGMNPSAMDAEFAHTNINTVLVCLGNHEYYGQITPLLDAHPGSSVRVSGMRWLLSRPARLTIGGRAVLSLGGAASVDRHSQIEGVSWWPDEAINDRQVAEAIAGGAADVMLSHESPAGTPVRGVREVLRTNPWGFPKDTLAESAESRARVAKVWDAVRPELLLHGHIHVAGGGATGDGRRVASLGSDGREGSLGLLDMRTLRMKTPSLREIRDAAAG